MKYKLLGSTGVKVSELCFGTMSFGSTADEKTSAELFNTCRDAGINFFDCADVYQKGRAEEILGSLIADCRKDLVITTKAGFPMSDDVNSHGCSRRHLMQAVEDSLKRLKTDYIDIYFMHRFDDETPIEETLRALDDMVKQGKILYPAASNYAAWQAAKALGISVREGYSKFICLQPMYNLVKRQAEVELFPMAISEKLGVISYSPSAAGLLSGKYGVERRPETGRLVENAMYKTRYAEDAVYKVAEDFTFFAKERGYNPTALAVAWAGSHPAVTAPIIGARNFSQLKDSLESVKIEMTDELRMKISSLSQEPPTATDRSEEKTEEFTFSARLKEKH
ncbi:MAG: aldo/keto reductase [Spirochaetia bacterium]|jgi:aryl-alcohol dehydrogenase-like predicted oxidoreductase|nr:aldo/keto reductase [Spirochaetia bacterium]